MKYLLPLLIITISIGCETKTTTQNPSSPKPLFTSSQLPANYNWAPGKYSIAEVSRGGLAIFDADQDGDKDILAASHPPADKTQRPSPNLLFLNSGNGKFELATDARGLDHPGKGSTFALADVNGDGRLDVFVGNLGQDALLIQNDQGRFEDRTQGSGLDKDEWTAGATFFDFDRDGDFDLYVSRYLIDDPSRICRLGIDSKRDYCGPYRYQSVADSLYENLGNGKFKDITQQAKVSILRAGFGAICGDFNSDGWPDLYVANDMQPNLLWINQKDGTFKDEALPYGVALSGAAKPEASMGLCLEDIDQNGSLDLFTTHLLDQTNTYYLRQTGTNVFKDNSARSGLGGPSLPMTGWGCEFSDFDLDGDLDLAVANGRIIRGEPYPNSSWPEFWQPYCELNLFYLNQNGKFKSSSSEGGSFTLTAQPSRSLAASDMDQDGDVDLIETDIANNLHLHLNSSSQSGKSWLSIKLKDGMGDGRGATIKVQAGGKTYYRSVLSSKSFSTAVEPEAHLGLGTAKKVDSVEVHWIDGGIEGFKVDSVNTVHTLERGKGKISRQKK